MRQILLSLCALSSLVLLGAAGQPAPRMQHPVYDDAQKAELDRLSGVLNAIRTLKSGFIQIGPEGQVDQGELYIEKPGRVRFEYKPPSPVLIVATGERVYVKNSRLNTVDSYDLSDTPLGLLLNDNVDLKTNSGVTGVESREGAVLLHARTSPNRNNSNIVLVFDGAGLELRQWTVKDNQGGSTTVALQNPVSGAPLEDSLFAVPVKAPTIKSSK